MPTIQPVTLMTLASTPQRARLVNTTDSSFPSRIPTVTRPSGLGDNAAQTTQGRIIDLAGVGVTVQNSVRLKAYGAGSDDATFSLRVIGWSYVIELGAENTAFWDPTILVELQATLSAVTGPAGGIITTTDRFADILTIQNSSANQGVNVNVVSPANDTAAHALIDFEGFQLLEVTFTTGSSATNCNALLALL